MVGSTFEWLRLDLHTDHHITFPQLESPRSPLYDVLPKIDDAIRKTADHKYYTYDGHKRERNNNGETPSSNNQNGSSYAALCMALVGCILTPPPLPPPLLVDGDYGLAGAIRIPT